MLQDGQGSTRQLLNSSQTVVATYINDAFGDSVGASGSSSNPFIWNGGSGYYSDAESGLQKVGARFYDPAVGRWISQDRMLIAGSTADSQALNRYNYCQSNPIARCDPSGRMTPAQSADWDDAWMHIHQGMGDMQKACYIQAIARLLLGFGSIFAIAGLLCIAIPCIGWAVSGVVLGVAGLLLAAGLYFQSQLNGLIKGAEDEFRDAFSDFEAMGFAPGMRTATSDYLEAANF